MKQTLGMTVTLACVVTFAPASRAAADVVDTRAIEQTVPVDSSEPLVVVVRNVVGPIRVIGHDSDRIELEATETVRGDLQADVDRARAAVELKTESEPGRVAFRVRRTDSNGDGDCACFRGQWDGYSVEYDIELRVPRTAALDLATVNGGDVTAQGVHGSFTLANVNGAVRLTDARGSGSVRTVNGDVEVAFERAPTEPTSFKTVNGALDVTFPANLAGELEFATMQGEVFTDFDVEPLQQPPTVQDGRTRGRFRMRTGSETAFRVGAGGARHSFHTLNGDIYVRKASQ